VIIDHKFAQPDLPAWPTSYDLLALANCSLHAENPQEAFEVCQRAIKLDPSNGHAHAILGEALSALGQEIQAMEHFSLATQLAPHKSESWLSLSKANLSAGKRDKAIETLRTASHAVPDDPAIFFALGQIHLEDDSLTQADTAIGKAFKLVSQPTFVNSPARSADEPLLMETSSINWDIPTKQLRFMKMPTKHIHPIQDWLMSMPAHYWKQEMKAPPWLH
jgi:Flp pilus assembly protein TadD